MEDTEYIAALESIASKAYGMGREDGAKEASEREATARQAEAQAAGERRASALKEYRELMAKGRTEEANRIYCAVFLT